jgi:hypothetical protein
LSTNRLYRSLTSIQFDWTWEGAVAFRPGDISGFRGDADITDDFLVKDEEGSSATVWAGEVVTLPASG